MSKTLVNSWLVIHDDEQYDVTMHSYDLECQDQDWRITNEEGWEFSGDVSDPWVTNGKSYPTYSLAFAELDKFLENRPMSNMLDDLNNLEVQVADLKTKLMMILDGHG